MLQLEQIDNGVFDLVVDDGSDDAALRTLIYAALFTDAQAPVARVPDQWERRGWWEAPAMGSGVWHVRRQPLGAAARREALDMVRSALALKAPALSNIAVTEVPPAGNISGVFVQVSGQHHGRQFLMRLPI
jgi:phage gp46-like protein